MKTANEIRLNLDQVAVAWIYRHRVNHNFEYRNASKIFGFIPYEKEGWYYKRTFEFYRLSNTDELDMWLREEQSYVGHENVVYNPHITFELSDGHRIKKWFKSVDDLDQFLRTHNIAGVFSTRWVDVD